jgi:hypothetical protein
MMIFKKIKTLNYVKIDYFLQYVSFFLFFHGFSLFYIRSEKMKNVIETEKMLINVLFLRIKFVLIKISGNIQNVY